MRSPVFLGLALGLFCLPASGQASVGVQALNPAGVALVDGSNKVLAQNIKPNQPITQNTKLHVQTKGTSSQYFIDYAQAEVKPPVNWSTFYNSRVSITSKAVATKGTSTKSLFTTDNTTGKPGTQKYRITLSSKTAKTVFLDFWTSGTNYGNAAATIKMTLGPVTRKWTWAKPAGYVQYHEKVPFTVKGTTYIDVEITGTVAPGIGGGKRYDGYECRYSLTVVPNNPGTFTSFGKGCGPAVLTSTAPPASGTAFTLKVDKAPATATAAVFLIGTSTTYCPFINIKLPFALDKLGAPGCTLYVSALMPVIGVWSTPGSFTRTFYLNPWYSYTYHIQAIVLDPKANQAGFTMTQAATLKF